MNEATTIDTTAPRSPVPAFRMLSPAGWTLESIDDAADRASQALRAPDAPAWARGAAPDALTELRRSKAFMVLQPTSPEATRAPFLLVGTHRSASSGAAMLEYLRALIDQHGATQPDDQGQFVRWIEADQRPIENQTVRTTSVHYLAPIPRTRKREALQLTGIVTHTLEQDAASPEVARWLATIDAIVGTFTWASTVEGA